MDICHPHNLNRAYDTERRYGIRVTLPAEDSFARVLGTDWAQLHWFFTEAERDRALADMQRRHDYSRRGDRPTVVFEKIERDRAAAA
ncbi:MAG: hypothetical protein JJT93_03630 [Gammaproteobacteria bacterium]|nr:hypothetical protein [Gammaproteobacteria bacterium]